MMITEQKRDQQSLNALIRTTNKFNINWDYLPDQFFGAGLFTGKIWELDQELIIPKDIVLHHANYTVGVPNKIAQLKYVAYIVNN